MKIKCSMCNAKSKLVNDEHLPYRWSEVHRKTADCHDSEAVSFESKFYLCPDCIGVVLGHVNSKLQAELDNLEHQAKLITPEQVDMQKMEAKLEFRKLSESDRNKQLQDELDKCKERIELAADYLPECPFKAKSFLVKSEE